MEKKYKNAPSKNPRKKLFSLKSTPHQRGQILFKIKPQHFSKSIYLGI